MKADTIVQDTTRYRIVYRIDGKLHYTYHRHVYQVLEALRSVLPTTTDWHIEVLEADGQYHKREAYQ